jgi:hypothetical protein
VAILNKILNASNNTEQDLKTNGKDPAKPLPGPQFWGSKIYSIFPVPPELGVRGPDVLQQPIDLV